MNYNAYLESWKLAVATMERCEDTTNTEYHKKYLENWQLWFYEKLTAAKHAEEPEHPIQTMAKRVMEHDAKRQTTKENEV